MRRFMFLIIALAILLPSLAQAYDVLVLQSRRDPSYDETLKGFRAERTGSQRVIIMSDYAEVDLVRIVREERPRLILTLGDLAFKEARKVRQTPIIALMTLGITPQINQSNIAGISMFANPQDYLIAFRAMNTKRVGLLVNPAKNGWYLLQARRAAQEMELELVVREVTSSKDTISQLQTLAGKIDALWMLPDPAVITRTTAESYFLFAQKQSLPLVSFAPAYLTMGAAAVVDIDRYETGRQAGIMAGRLLAGETAQVLLARGSIKSTSTMLTRFKLPTALLNNISSARN